MLKKRTFYAFPLVMLAIVLAGGCEKTSHFTVEGIVAGAAGQTLYLENTGLSSVTVIDSFKLKPDGKFKFEQPSREYPDFYRLNLKNQLIHFSIDSTETVSFTADAHNFATSYTVEGSENSKAMKEITLAQLDANQAVRVLRDSYGMNIIPDTTYEKRVLEAVKSYKETSKKYIFGAPKSPAAYFALFQQVDGLWLFDLYDKTDSKAYGAVATSYKYYYPESPRSKQLEKLALQSLKVTRGERRASLDVADAKEVDYIDIEMPGIDGKNIKLSDIAKGKAVLVNFTAYQTEWSPAFNMRLSEVYAKYHDKGLEIYQISLDGDSHFWKNVASKTPWTCVLDPQSIYSSIAAIYNVRQLPALFLLNSKGVMVKRIDSIDSIESEVEAAI